jgi:hypothetical protein
VGRGKRPQEAGADRRADRVLPGAKGPRLWLPVQGLDRLQGDRAAARHGRWRDQYLPAGQALPVGAAWSRSARSQSRSPARCGST